MINEQELLSQVQSIAAEQRDGRALYALLDSAIYAGATIDGSGKSYGNLAEELTGARLDSLFSYAFDDHRTDVSPLLVLLPDLDSEWAVRIAGLAIQYNLASWVWSSRPIDELARHLAAFIRAEMGDIATMLRPYDPRIMEDTIACFDPARQAALWELVEAWAYFDGGDALKRLQRPAVQPASPLTMPLILDSNERKRFEGLADRIALGTYIETHVPALMTSMSPVERKVFCEQQISIGKTLKTDSMSDLHVIAALSAAHGSGWIGNEAIAPLLQAIVSGTAPLSAIASQLDEQLKQQPLS